MTEMSCDPMSPRLSQWGTSFLASSRVSLPESIASLPWARVTATKEDAGTCTRLAWNSGVSCKDATKEWRRASDLDAAEGLSREVEALVDGTAEVVVPVGKVLGRA